MLFELWTAWDFVRDYHWWFLGASVAILAMLAWAYFTGSIKVALEALAALAVAITAGQIYRRGAASEKARNDAAADRSVAETKAAQTRVDGMTDAEVDARLDQWVPKETKP